MAMLVTVDMRGRLPIQPLELIHLDPENLPKVVSQPRVVKEDRKFAAVEKTGNPMMLFFGRRRRLTVVGLVQI